MVSASFNPMNRTLHDYETTLRSTGASERTVECRIRHARTRLAVWPDPAAVTVADIRGYLAQPHFSRWTRRTYYGHLASMFAWMLEAGLIVVDPMTVVKRPPQPRGVPHPLNVREVALVLAHATGQDRSFVLLGMCA